MNKLKGFLAVLLCCVCIGICAFLPGLTVFLSDHARNMGHEPLTPVSLGEEESTPSTPIDKLTLMRYEGQRVLVSERMMKSTSQEIMDAMEAYLAQFWDAGVFPEVDMCYEKIFQPCMLFDSEGRSHDLFWQVSLILGHGDMDVGFFCIMDDASHHVFKLNYSLFPISHEHLSQWMTEEKIVRVCDLFFEELGFTPERVESQNPDVLLYQIQHEQYGTFFYEIEKNDNGYTMVTRK